MRDFACLGEWSGKRRRSLRFPIPIPIPNSGHPGTGSGSMKARFLNPLPFGSLAVASLSIASSVRLLS
jgi:hypothetical protein